MQDDLTSRTLSKSKSAARTELNVGKEFGQDDGKRIAGPERRFTLRHYSPVMKKMRKLGQIGWRGSGAMLVSEGLSPVWPFQRELAASGPPLGQQGRKVDRS